MIQKHFEVKTGKNRGFYIVSMVSDKKDFIEKLGNNWGWQSIDDVPTFFIKHGLNNMHLVWTQSKFASHEFNRKDYAQTLDKLGCINHPDNREELHEFPF